MKESTKRLIFEIEALSKVFNINIDNHCKFYECFDLIHFKNENELNNFINLILNAILSLKETKAEIELSPNSFKNELHRVSRLEKIFDELEPLLKDSLLFYNLNDIGNDHDLYKQLQVVMLIVQKIKHDNLFFYSKLESNFYKNGIKNRPKKDDKSKMILLFLCEFVVKHFNEQNISKHKLNHKIQTQYFQTKAVPTQKYVTPTIFIMLLLQLIGENKTERTVNKYFKINFEKLKNDIPEIEASRKYFMKNNPIAIRETCIKSLNISLDFTKYLLLSKINLDEYSNIEMKYESCQSNI